MKDTNLILAKDIRIDKEYNNVLSINEQQMIALLNSAEHFVASATNYSFIRDAKNVITTPLSYEQCLQSNYIAFKNTSYSNKWFFAFIERCEFVSPGATKIYFKLDVHTTFFNDWDPKQCFIEREHVTNDAVGANTVPEGLETGDYIQTRNPININPYATGSFICIAVTEVIITPPANMQLVNGVFTGLYFLICSNAEETTKWLNAYASKGKSDAIVTIFLIPKEFAITDHARVITGKVDGVLLFAYVPNETDVANVLVEQKDVSKPTSLAGYTPKNKKLLTYPYQYFNLTNNAGIDVPMKWEDFDGKNASFKVVGAVTPGCSIRCIPLNYKNADTDKSYNYGIQGGKFPVCAWSSDVYTNWLTQNGVNIALSAVSGIGQIVAGGVGIATGAGALAGAGAVASGITQITGTMSQVYQHSMIPDQARGNTNAGDVGYSTKQNVFSVYSMCIKNEYAKMIDEYFTRFGYKVNRTKKPNIKTRKMFNYLKIGSSESIGYGAVPAEYMTEINNIYRRGTTIWHKHSDIGIFDGDNSNI